MPLRIAIREKENYPRTPIVFYVSLRIVLNIYFMRNIEPSLKGRYSSISTK